MKIGDVASAVGKGVVAGAAGTVAMTLFQMLEMKVANRKRAVGRVASRLAA